MNNPGNAQILEDLEKSEVLELRLIDLENIQGGKVWEFSFKSPRFWFINPRKPFSKPRIVNA